MTVVGVTFTGATVVGMIVVGEGRSDPGRGVA